jgi:pyruvate formate lyase activating enzyme
MVNPDTLNPDVPLVASPYDLRVSLGEKVSEPDARAAMETGDFGFVHSFTTGSAVDGPGVRVIVWLTGCQFRCAYCHNPDTWKMPNGMPVSLARAVEVIGQYRTSLRTMKGGLTVSGGEPLMQRKFVIRLFQEAQKKGIHTAIDTNGHLGERVSDDDLQAIDLVMLGFKAFSPDVHKRLTGQDNAAVHVFARRLAALRRPMWFRFVIVPDFTDDLDEVAKIADFAASLGNVERIEVLPFHQMGRFKWEKLGMDYSLRDAVPPSTETVNKVISRFREAGLVAV